jgi:uncharacterized protein (DUF2147 family)
MSRFMQGAAALALATAFSASGAFGATSLGVYQTTDRKMDYDLSLCGPSEKALCVTLQAARGTAATDGVKPYIGQMVVNQAPAAGKNRWKGKMRIGDYELKGSLTLSPGEKFVMSGCVFIVVCEDFTLIPAK